MRTYIHSVLSTRQTFDVKCEIRSDFLPNTNSFMGKIDTGCSSTMISLDVLYPNKAEDELRDIALKLFEWAFQHKRIRYGIGVESNKSDVIHAKNSVEALDNVYIRVPISCNNVTIKGCVLGMQEMNIAYKAKGKSLIGMEILKGLCTYIGPYKGEIHLVSSREALFNTDKLMSHIVKAIKAPDYPGNGLIDFSDEKILEANFIRQLLKNDGQYK